MKRIINAVMVCLLLVSLAACGKNTHPLSKPTLTSELTQSSESVSASVLEENLFKVRYRSDPFSITIGDLVDSTMDGYNIKYLKCDEAVNEGYLTEDQIGDDVNREKFYFAIISGETMVNPNIPYMTEYEEEAVIAWMIFDDNNKLVNSGASLCENLEVCAIMLMTSSY